MASRSDFPLADFAEMSSVNLSRFPDLPCQHMGQLSELLDQYVASLQQGAPLDSDALVASHPHLADPLRWYAKSLRELHDVAAGTESWRFDGPTLAANLTLGDYRLVREIGRGGMGMVFEAQQVSLNRRVAIKLLPWSACLDETRISRFKNEANAAAQLHHPHIVPIIAIGEYAGLHYYVMRYIDGLPLDQIVHRGPLDAAQVARIGAQAAAALHAAHEIGIVHRDIKPSNLLLDASGKLWVTDFGLARCRHDAALTRSGDLVGTLRYMSPEQAAGKSALVDHRTDIYSLGVTLYELLGGQPAIRGEDGPGLLRGIEQQTPTRLRALRREIPADLETVIAKAMSKQRDHRYESAMDFAADLCCVVEGRPTKARPICLAMRMARWTARHRALAMAAALAVLLTALGFATSTVMIARQKQVAQRNLAQAREHFREAHDAVERLGTKAAELLTGIPGAEPVRRVLLEETLTNYREFVRQAAADSTLRRDVARTLAKMGELTLEAGSTTEAIRHLESAREVYEVLLRESADEAELGREEATNACHLGLAYARAGNVPQALAALRHAIDVQSRRLTMPEPGDADQPSLDLATSYNHLGLLYGQSGKAADAASALDHGLHLVTPLADQTAPAAAALQLMAAILNNQASLFSESSPAEAAARYQRSLDVQYRVIRLQGASAPLSVQLALTYNNLGSARARCSQWTTAIEAYRKAMAIQRRLVELSPTTRSYQRDLAVSANNLAMAQLASSSRQDASTQAEATLRRAIELQESQVAEYPSDAELHSELGGMLNNLARALDRQQRLPEAIDVSRAGIRHQRIALSKAPTIKRYRDFLDRQYANCSCMLTRAHDLAAAAEMTAKRRALWPGHRESEPMSGSSLNVKSKAFPDDNLHERQASS